MNKSILITGANAGIGKDAARQLALISSTEKIYLACRNETKAIAAKKSLEESTGRNIFEIVMMDVSDPDSVKSAVDALPEPIDALIMNAGGMGGKTPNKITKDGVIQMFAVNVLGHVVLVNELLAANKLNNVALYASSEAARGLPKMGMKPPKMKTGSVEEFTAIIDGTNYSGKKDPMVTYAYVKYMGSLWMSAVARTNPNIRFISLSPGGTAGTEIMNNMGGIQKIMFKYVLMPLVMPLMGLVHSLETGAKRYVDGINDEAYQSGNFYASKENKLTGPMIDQGTVFTDFKNTEFQDNAAEAISKFLKTHSTAVSD